MKVPEGYLDIQGAALMAGCSETTIRNYYRDGHLKYVKVGKQKVAIAVSEIERLLRGEIDFSAKHPNNDTHQ